MHYELRITTNPINIEGVIYKEPLFFPYLDKLMIRLFDLGYIKSFSDNKHNFSEKVTSNIVFRDNKLYLKSYWQNEYCSADVDTRGFNKSLFVDMQVIAWELMLFAQVGLFNYSITVDGKQFAPNIHKLPIGNSTKKSIRNAKQFSGYDFVGDIKKCKYKTGNIRSGYILACCLCRGREIYLGEVNEK